MDASQRQEKIVVNHKWKEWLVQGIAYLYILLFLYAASSKLMTYDLSYSQMLKSPIITDYANVLVWLVPATEILLSILLFFPATVKLALYGSLLLMSFFTVYIYVIMKYSVAIPCSCGGILSTLGWQEHLYFNLVFIILAILGILLRDPVK